MQQTEIARTIGAKVRAGRKRLGLTRKQLAASADVSERYLNALENGEANASVGFLLKVAEALDIEFVSLLAQTSDAVQGERTLQNPGLAALIGTMTAAEQTGAVGVLERYLDERRRAHRGIALLGLRGAGKSTLGRRLAERHGIAFVSVTREIEARAGMSLAELFNLGGPDSYRTLENEVVAEMSSREDRIVLETAGGIVGNAQALDMILGAFKTVWLKASPAEHLARVAGQGDMRPMRGDPRALDHLKALLAAREPDYARADCLIDTSGRTVDDCFADLEAIAASVFTRQTA